MLPDNKNGVYYLASPYSHDDPMVKRERYLAVVGIASVLTKMGYVLIEPIGTSHPMAELFTLDTGWEYWSRRDHLLIERCDGLIVAMMNGWQDSRGVQAEIKKANELEMPIYYINPANFIGYESRLVTYEPELVQDDTLTPELEEV